jgi:hypothetical protein
LADCILHFIVVAGHGTRDILPSRCVWKANVEQYIMYNSEFWLNLHGIWDGWPFREVEGVFKWYYLVQWAFYIQQILVVNIEEKRKDFAQMLTHHIFTTALLFLSYGYYHMRVGLVIMCTMDFVDIILPVSLQFIQSVGEVARADHNRLRNC